MRPAGCSASARSARRGCSRLPGSPPASRRGARGRRRSPPRCGRLLAGRLAQAGVVRGQVGQGAQRRGRGCSPPAAAAGTAPTARAGRRACQAMPHWISARGQRVQAPEVDLRRPHHRRGRRAPPAEGRLVGVLDRDGQPAVLIAVAPRGRQDGASRAALPAVAPRRAGSTAPAARTPSPGRRGRGSGRSREPAPGRPATGRSPRRPVPVPVVIPAELVVMTQPQASGGRPGGPGRSGTAAPRSPRRGRAAGPPGGSRPASRPRRGALRQMRLVSAAQVAAPHRRSARSPRPGSSTGRQDARRGS